MKKILSVFFAFATLTVLLFVIASCGKKESDPCADGHSWKAWTTVEPTCGEDGKRYRTCKECGEEEIDEKYSAPATGRHSFTSEGVCSKCGNPCNHDYKMVSSKTTKATCEEDGKEYYKCSRCEHENIVEVAATGHKLPEVGNVTAPTCANEGFTSYVCEICYTRVKKDIKPATGKHVLGEWDITQYETDYVDGFKIQKCTECKQTINSAVIPHRKNFDELTIKNFLYTGGKYNKTPFVNVAAYGSVNANNYYRTTAAKNMLDGALSTYWQADTMVEGGDFTGSEIVITLAKAYDLGAISLIIPNYTSWGLGEGCYVSYKIEAYVNGSWVYLGELSDKTANDPISENATATLTFAEPVTTDKLRATVTHSTRYAPAKIHEIEVYGFAEEILRESKNIGANATISISGKRSAYLGGDGTNLVDGNLSKGWDTNARDMMTGDNAITRSTIEFKYLKDVKSEFVQLGNVSITLDNRLGERVRLLYYTVKTNAAGVHSTAWEALPLDGADGDGWYTITSNSGSTTVTFDASSYVDGEGNPIKLITSHIKLQVDGYIPAGEYLKTMDDFPPTVTAVNISCNACTVDKVDTTYEEQTDEIIGYEDPENRLGPIYKTETKPRPEADIMYDKIASATVGASKSATVTELTWTEKTEVYVDFRWASEQFITYIAWVVPSVAAAVGKEYKLFIERNGEWEEYANPYPETDGRYVVPKISGQSKYTFNVDINDNITAFRIQMIYEPDGRGMSDIIYEVMPYSVVENEVDPVRSNACAHTIMAPVEKDEDGNAISVAPTCTKAGYTMYKCINCGYTARTDATDAVGHNWGNYTTKTPAGTMTAGLEEVKCRECQVTKQRVIPATGGSANNAGWELPTITKYYHNAPAAWSMTLDDGNYISTYEWIIPRLQEYGFKATAVLAINFSGSYVGKWQKYFQTGVIDLGSHSMTHGPYYHGAVSEAGLISDVNDAVFRFMSYFHGQRLLGFAAPNGATSEEVADFLMDIMGAGRRGDGWFNDPDKLTSRKMWGRLESYVARQEGNKDYVGKYEFVKKSNVSINYVYDSSTNRLVSKPGEVGTYFYDEDNYRYEWRTTGSYNKVGEEYVFVENNSGEYILAHTTLGEYETAINRLLSEGSWSVECIHEIALGGAIYVDYDSTIAKFEYLKKTGVWVCSYNDAIQYFRERQNAEVVYKSVDMTTQKMVLDITQTLDDYMFNHALTIKVPMFQAWITANISADRIKVTQGGVEVEYCVVEGGYCYFDAIPNGGEIVITLR